MPLQAPNLDDRSYDQLLAQARLRIPRYTSEWTDFNDSDPGMTLVQLFAWLSEMLLHKLNQVPDRNYIQFLKLLNLELEPARPATAHLSFTGEGKDPIIIPAGTRAGAQPPGGGDMLIFETTEALGLVRTPLSEVLVYDGTGFTRVSTHALSPGMPFRPFGWLPQQGSALYLGFGTDKDAERPDAPFPQQLRLRVLLPLDPVAPRAQLCGQDNLPPAPPVELVWEYEPRRTPGRWRRLNLFRDDSAAFTREGDLVIEGPQDIGLTEAGPLSQPKERRYWLRCRLSEGSYPAGRAPELDFLQPNAVPAQNRATVREERIGVSDGRPDQRLALRQRPVLYDSLVLRVETPGEDPSAWTRAEHFLGSGPDDLHYTLNHNSGEIRFGDGERGEIPPASAVVVAEQYIYGGGSAGNVGPGQIKAGLSLPAGAKLVPNPRPAAGGKDEQQLERLKEEAPARIRCRNRAITAEDYTGLALEAGGVARATAIALAHPDHPGVEVPGAVTVVIVPDNEDPKPLPGPELLSSVCRYLDERRPLGTEVYVAPPRYREANVEAQLEAEPYTSADQLIADVQAALTRFLDPLGRPRGGAGARSGRTPPAAGGAGQPGGTTPGAGQPGSWGFGQDLHPTSLYGAILSVKGVRAVKRLALIVDGRPHDTIQEPVKLERDQLIFGRDHLLVVVPAEER